jgi:hypothetical protein
MADDNTKKGRRKTVEGAVLMTTLCQRLEPLLNDEGMTFSLLSRCGIAYTRS